MHRNRIPVHLVSMKFRNRRDAGRLLADVLTAFKSETGAIIALPRGGVIAGSEIAQALGAPLDLVVTRKIGHPHAPEYAIAAVAEDGDMIGNQSEIHAVSVEWFQGRLEEERQEARRRREFYAGARGTPPIGEKTVILTDDGLATGLTMSLAIHEMRHRNPARIVVAVPVASPEAMALIRPLVDDVILLDKPENFGRSIGEHYHEFPQIQDEEVREVLLRTPAMAGK